MPRAQRSRNIMGVVYNYTSADNHHGMAGYQHMGECLVDKLAPFVGGALTFYLWGEEICPRTNTPHLQCFFVFKNDMTLANAQAFFSGALGFPSTLALKMADGNVAACIEYCEKECSNLVSGGVRPKGKGARSDLAVVAELIQAGASVSDIAELCPVQFMRGFTGITRLVMANAKPRDFDTQVFWLHGTTGTGKSRWAMEQVDRSDCYFKNGSNKWWDGYTGQRDVIMDDFRPTKELPFEYMLGLMQNLPFLIEMKGATAHFTSHRIFITTPLPPVETWARCDWLTGEALAQFTRRITQVIEFTPMQFQLGYADLPPPSEPVLNTWANAVTRPKRDFSAIMKKAKAGASRVPTTGPPVQAAVAAVAIAGATAPDPDSDTEADSDAGTLLDSGESEPEDGISLDSQDSWAPEPVYELTQTPAETASLRETQNSGYPSPWYGPTPSESDGNQSEIECDYVTSDDDDDVVYPRRRLNRVADSDSD